MDRAGRERGATAVGYALMVAIIALLLVAGVMVLSGSVESVLGDGAACVVDPSECGDSPGSGPGSGGGGPGGGGGGGGSGATTTTGPTSTSTTLTAASSP